MSNLLKFIFSIHNIRRFGIKRKYVKILGIDIEIPHRVKSIKFDKNLIDIEKVFNINKNLEHNNCAIFASFNRDGKIAEHVLYMIKELKKVTDNIIFVCDNPIDEKEIEKIKDYVSVIYAKRHEMYDFGSYKIGYKLADKYGLFDGIEELLVLNDSCFGPVDGFKKVIDDFHKKSSDIYGLSINYQITRHIQSYFYIFKKKVFLSEPFKEFLNKVKKEPGVDKVIEKYELKFSNYLEKFGFSSATYLPEQIPEINKDYNSLIYSPILLRKYNFPFIKIKIFKEKVLIEDYQGETLDILKEKNSFLYNIVAEKIKEFN